MKKKTIFITGCCGFIGSSLVEYLHNDPTYHIIGIDNMQNNVVSIENIGNLLDQFIYTDISKASSKIFCDIDIIIHLAATPGVKYGEYHSSETLMNNVIGFNDMLNLAKEHHCKKIIYASSSSVYGSNDSSQKKFYINENEEDDRCDIQLSVYAASKRMNELQAKQFSLVNDDIQMIGLRFFTVYGKNMRKDLGIYKFVDAALNDQPIYVFGDGKQMRDFTYIDDLIYYIKRFVDEDGYSDRYEIYNIGQGHPISINNLLDIISEKTGKKLNIIYEEARKFDMKMTCASNNKLSSKFGYHHEWVSIDKGIERYIKTIIPS